MSRIFFRLTGLLILWIILSGKIDCFHLSLGILSALLIVLFGYRAKHKPHPSRTLAASAAALARALGYGFWLLTRIITAAIHVAALIVSPRMPIRPGFIRHRTFLREDIEKVLFANSITLTPGTITADIEGNDFIIHRLDAESSGDIESQLTEHEIKKIALKGKP